MNKKSKVLLTTIILMVVLTGLVSAQSLLPEFIQDIIDGWEGSSAVDKLVGFIRLALTLAFGAVVLVAVVYSILAAFKFIQSQGDAGKVEEANKSVKAIFQGVVAMFVGIIGIVIVFFIFDVALPDPSLPEVCIECPDTLYCRVCTEGNEDDGSYTYQNVTYRPDCDLDLPENFDRNNCSNYDSVPR